MSAKAPVLATAGQKSRPSRYSGLCGGQAGAASGEFAIAMAEAGRVGVHNDGAGGVGRPDDELPREASGAHGGQKPDGEREAGGGETLHSWVSFSEFVKIAKTRSK